jgi:hypothetical protein
MDERIKLPQSNQPRHRVCGGHGAPPKRAAENQELLGDWLLTYRTGERVRDDFDGPLQCLEPPLAIASMRPLARMAEDVALDILFDGG